MPSLNKETGKAGKEAGKGIRPRVPVLLRCSFLPLLVSGFWLPAPKADAELTVGAAISLSDAVTEISAAFEEDTGKKIRHTFAGTNVIARQIESGAPIDVFISADTTHMDALVAKGLIDKDSVRITATNELVVIVPAETRLPPKSPRDLLALERIAIADPTSVPAGIYARKWMMAEGIWDRIAPKTIPLQNVRAALIATETGNAPAAITYRSDAISNKKVKVAFAADPGKTGAIAYPAAVVGASGKKREARAFLEFLATDAAVGIFRKHGFGTP